MTDAVLVYVTTANEEEAVRIGTEVVKKRLAACANIVPAIRSVYWWEGEVHSEGRRCSCSSRGGSFGTSCASPSSLHSYEVPAISGPPRASMSPTCSGYCARQGAPQE